MKIRNILSGLAIFSLAFSCNFASAEPHKFTVEEDKMLIDYIRKNEGKAGTWVKVSQMINGTSARECFKRWHQLTALTGDPKRPPIQKKYYALDMGKSINELVEKFGLKWPYIAKCLNSTEIACKNSYYSYLNSINKDNKPKDDNSRPSPSMFPDVDSEIVASFKKVI